MRAVAVWASAKLRIRWRTWVALAILVGLGGGAVLTALAGARRTDSAYRRFTMKYLAADALVYGVVAPGFGVVDFDSVAHLAEVAATGRVVGLASEVAGGVTAPADDHYGRVVGVPKVLSGRLPRSDRADEAAVS